MKYRGKKVGLKEKASPIAYFYAAGFSSVGQKIIISFDTMMWIGSSAALRTLRAVDEI